MIINIIKIVVFVVVVAVSQTVSAQMSILRRGIDKIIDKKDATIGVSLYDFSDESALSINGDEKFPMQSVFKFHIALAVLNEVDNGNLELDQTIFIPRSKLHENTWSPIREKYPQGDIQLTLSELIRYTVAQSDNNGCDILLEMIGGASAVNKYIKSKGISGVNIEKNEQEMKTSWDVQFLNWTTPKSAVKLLKLFNNKQLLQEKTHLFLWQIMAETSTGSVKNNLPENAIVAHKTGYSGVNADGISAAINDIGVLVLPDGGRIAYAIFITDSKETLEVNYSIIADIASVIFEIRDSHN